MKIPAEIKMMIDKIVGEDMIVYKSVPLKKEWKSRWDELEKLAEQEQELSNKRQSKAKAFWAMVDEQSDDYCPKRFNDETNEVEFLKDKDKAAKKPLGKKSPLSL